jgi:hypothetical protein
MSAESSRCLMSNGQEYAAALRSIRFVIKPPRWVDSVWTDSMIVRQSDHPVKDYFFDGDPFSEDGATGRIGE